MSGSGARSFHGEPFIQHRLAPRKRRAAAGNIAIPSRRPWLLFSYPEIADLLVECAIQEGHDLSAGAGVVRAEQAAADAAGDAVLLRPFHGFVKAQGLIHNSLWL